MGVRLRIIRGRIARISGTAAGPPAGLALRIVIRVRVRRGPHIRRNKALLAVPVQLRPVISAPGRWRPAGNRLRPARPRLPGSPGGPPWRARRPGRRTRSLPPPGTGEHRHSRPRPRSPAGPEPGRYGPEPGRNRGVLVAVALRAVALITAALVAAGLIAAGLVVRRGLVRLVAAAGTARLVGGGPVVRWLGKGSLRLGPACPAGRAAGSRSFSAGHRSAAGRCPCTCRPARC